MVIGSHLVLCFAPQLVYSAPGDHNPSTFFQLPFIRLPVQGPAWVALFITLSGYTNSVKPIKLATAERTDEALSNLSRSSFRRTGRLVFPSIAATVASWLLCQMGAYRIGKASDAWWIENTSPNPSKSWVVAFSDLLRSIIQTWTDGNNEYDQPQWTFIHILKGSMLAFTLLLVTVYIRPKYRMLICFGLYVYSWLCAECKFSWLAGIMSDRI
jgi:hypothetical protein